MSVEQIITSVAGLLKAISELLSIADDSSFLGLVLILAAILTTGLYFVRKEKQQREFRNFTSYLFNNAFDILPKICIALDSSGRTNKLNVSELDITYTYDLRGYEKRQLAATDQIEFPCTMEYVLKAENKKIPAQFYHYRGNMNAVGEMTLEQRHGSQAEYTAVSPKDKPVESLQKNSAVQEFCWLLRKENNDGLNPYVIRFRCGYMQTSTASYHDSIIFYPLQYAEKIGTVNYTFRFLGKPHMIRRVQLYKIFSDGGNISFTPVTELTPQGNSCELRIGPDCVKCEAYQIRLEYSAAEE